MAVSKDTRARLENLVGEERTARAAQEAARAALVEALVEARRHGGSTRELAPIVGMSHQLVFHITRKR